MASNPPGGNILFAVVLCVGGMFLGARVSAEEAAEKNPAPALRSIFPLGGSPASRFEAVVRGENLEGVHAVSFDCRNVTAEIKEVREVEAGESESEPDAPAAKKEQEQPKTVHEVRLGIEITPGAEVGAHTLRLVTPRGVSNALWFMVDSEPVILETDEPHATLPETQAVTFPVIVNGKLAKPGELDYYSFQVARGQELQLEVRVTELPHDQLSLDADPELILYKPTGSWFDPDRGARLEVTDLWRPPLGDYPHTTSHRLPRVRRVFEEAGRYVAKVGTVGGDSGPDYSYQLRIVPVNRTESQEPERWKPLVSAAHGAGPIAWENRSFTAEIGPGRLGRLSSRTPSAIAPPPELEAVAEKEPNDAPAQALEVPVPVIVQGVVGRPADEDWFQIQVKEGDKLAFEVETPYLPPPFFNPRVAIFDADGKELANSIYRALGGDGDDWIKTLAPKILYTFRKAGEYRIQVRDLTSRVSGDDFTYRLLIRPQVPHVGEVAARGVDRLHLEAGESRSFQVTAELEEGFQGEVALSVENLPPGVSAALALGAGDKENTPTAKPGGQIHRERYFPEKRSGSIMLIAASDAPPYAAAAAHPHRRATRRRRQDRGCVAGSGDPPHRGRWKQTGGAFVAGSDRMKRKARVTVQVLRQMKQAGEKITMLTAYDYFTARVLDQCGVDILLVGDTVGMAFAGHDTTLSVRIDHIVYHGEIVSRAAERAMIVGDMPFLSYQVNIDHAVENAGRLMQDAKVQAVKLEGGRAMVPVIKRILRAGIPVMGHLGLTPQSVHRFGGFRVQGKDPESAQRLREAARALEDVGCFSIVLEAVPADLAGEVTESLTIPTIGIGAGPRCDGQVLVTPDMLGITGCGAKYLKRYADVGEIISGAVETYIREVKDQVFPTEDHGY